MKSHKRQDIIPRLDFCQQKPSANLPETDKPKIMVIFPLHAECQFRNPGYIWICQCLHYTFFASASPKSPVQHIINGSSPVFICRSCRQTNLFVNLTSQSHKNRPHNLTSLTLIRSNFPIRSEQFHIYRKTGLNAHFTAICTLFPSIIDSRKNPLHRVLTYQDSFLLIHIAPTFLST